MNGIRNSEGFTLAEVMVALMILAIMAAGFIQSIVSAHRLQPVEMGKSVMVDLVREKMESLHEAVRQDWWTVVDKPLSPGTSLGSSENIVLDGKSFSRSYSANNVGLNGDGGGQDYRKVEVTVQ